MKPQPWTVTEGTVAGLYKVHDKDDRIGLVPKHNGTAVYHYQSDAGEWWSCEEHEMVYCEHRKVVDLFLER